MKDETITRKKLMDIRLEYQMQMMKAVELGKESEDILIDYYDDKILSNFLSWEDVLQDINYMCGDTGVGKLLAIRSIQIKFKLLKDKS